VVGTGRATVAPRPGARRAVGVLLAVLVGLALLEAGFRVLAGGSAAEIARLAAELEGWRETPEQVEPDERPRETIHPYVGWANSNWEVRYGELGETFSDEAFEVLVMGGSVAAMVAGYGGDAIRETLTGDPRIGGREVRVMHVARGSVKQPQQVLLLAYLLDLGWRPDAVIEYDGFNELALAVQNALAFEVHPLHPAFFIWAPLMESSWRDPELEALRDEVRLERFRARSLADLVTRTGIDHSAVASRFALAEMRSIRTRFFAARDRYLERARSGEHGREAAGPPFEPGFESALELAVRNWVESSRSMHAMCAARGIAYLHVLQPTLHDRGSKPLAKSEIEAGAAGENWVQAIEHGYPRLRAAGERLAAEGVPFHDASRIFADDPTPRYTDACHVDRESNSLLARDMAQALLETLP